MEVIQVHSRDEDNKVVRNPLWANYNVDYKQIASDAGIEKYSREWYQHRTHDLYNRYRAKYVVPFGCGPNDPTTLMFEDERHMAIFILRYST